jgi:hypothetical protein
MIFRCGVGESPCRGRPDPALAARLLRGFCLFRCALLMLGGAKCDITTR